MAKELKIRVSDVAAVERALADLGADFVRSSRSRSTYFKQPEGQVLKLSTGDDGTVLTAYERAGSGFEITRQQTLDAAEAEASALTRDFGIDDVLDKHDSSYTYQDMIFCISRIAGRGNFLILTSSNPDASVFKQLGIDDPEYITVPFNELPTLTPESGSGLA